MAGPTQNVNRRDVLGVFGSALVGLVMPPARGDDVKPEAKKIDSAEGAIDALKAKIKSKEEIKTADIQAVVDMMSSGKEMAAYVKSQQAVTVAAAAVAKANAALNDANKANRGNAQKSDAVIDAEATRKDAQGKHREAIDAKNTALKPLAAQQDEILSLLNAGKLPTAAAREVSKPMSNAVKSGPGKSVAEDNDGFPEYSKAVFIWKFQQQFIGATNRLK